MLLVHLLCWATASAVAGPVAAPIPPPIGSDDNATAAAHPPSDSSSVSSAAVAPSTSMAAPPHNAECTSTAYIDLLQNIRLNNTRTVHAATVTSTRLYDCDGCSHLVVRNIGGIGPVVHFSTTVTDNVAPAVDTAYACSKSGSAAAMQTAVPPTTQSPSPPPALPTPRA